jgi:uncharacterized protein YyaL (SSP411 family)
MLNNLKDNLKTNPYNYSNWLNVMTNYTKPFYEVVVAGKKAKETSSLLMNTYLPNTIIAGATKDTASIPLLAYKFSEAETFIYVCVNGSCKLPQINIEKAINSIKR